MLEDDQDQLVRAGCLSKPAEAFWPVRSFNKLPLGVGLSVADDQLAEDGSGFAFFQGIAPVTHSLVPKLDDQALDFNTFIR